MYLKSPYSQRPMRLGFLLTAAVVPNHKTQAESPAMLGQTSPRDKHQWHRAAISPELLSSGGGLHTLGGLFDKSCDSLWLRHVDGMAALDLNDR
jgi:hypothetical protein